MDSKTYLYVTYISTTPEKLWKALTSGEFTQQYWGGRRLESDWKMGSEVKHLLPDGSTDWKGEVLEFDPHSKLAYTFGEGHDAENPTHKSRVTFELEHVGNVVKLTLIHDELTEEGFQAISFGWPAILSSLKSLLEGGSALEYERWF